MRLWRSWVDGWNHNTHYHPLVLRAAQSSRGRALEVGCGDGLLAGKLAEECSEVIAIDSDPDMLACAGRTRIGANFIEGDVMTYPFAPESFDLIASVATLHHLPLRPALERFKDLLKPGGMLVIIGLYELNSFVDYAIASAAAPASWIKRRGRPKAETAARMCAPSDTFHTIRNACADVLPDATISRRLYFRYSLVWSKP